MDPNNQNSQFPNQPLSNSTVDSNPQEYNSSPSEFKPLTQSSSTIPPISDTQPFVTSISPSNSNIEPNINSNDTPKKSKKTILYLSLLILVLLFLGGLGWFSYALAYEKIDPKFIPESVKNSLSYSVQSLSFMPKTPKFILGKTLLAHEGIKTHKFDVSVATDLGGIQETLGIGKFDLSAKGVVDYSNIEAMKADFTIDLSSELSIDIRKLPESFYFRLGKIPPILTSFIGIDESVFSNALNKWVYIDLKPLETNARTYLDENKEEIPMTKHILNISQKVMNDDEIKSKIVLTDDVIDSVKYHKMTFKGDNHTVIVFLNHIAEEFDDTKLEEDKDLGISNLVFDMWVSKSDYLTKRIAVKFDFKSPDSYGSAANLFSLTEGPKTISLSMVSDFSEFGKVLDIQAPESSISLEDFYKLFSGNYLMKMRSNASDAQIISDLHTLEMAVKMYYVDCGSYPLTLDDLLVSCKTNGQSGYLSKVPIDPTTSLPYFYQLSGNIYNLCAKVDNPEGALPCDLNPSYNYAVTNADLN